MMLMYICYLRCNCLFSGPVKLRDREYLGTVQAIKLNEDYAAVRFDGKLQLHTVSQHVHR